MLDRCVLALTDKHLRFMVQKLPSPSCNYDVPAVALSSSASCVEVAATSLLPFLASDLKDALGQSGSGGTDLGGPGPN